MRIPSILTLSFALAFGLGAAARAQSTAPARSAKPVKTAKKSPPPTNTHEIPGAQAKSVALAADTSETIDTHRLGVAARVLTGKAECEFNLSVDVNPLAGKPGYFQVHFKNADYIMVPEETTTGAVKLLERRSGVIWLQIPTKSMLLDSREGRRLVDACTLAEQRAAIEAVAAAAGSTVPAAMPIKN